MITIEDTFCDVCGKRIRRGMTNESETFFTHSKCFSKYMDKEYGKNNWMLEDQGWDEKGNDYWHTLHYLTERGGACTEDIVCKDFE